MKLKRLILNNFGIYSGSNTFDFSSDKPVVLIGGMNGQGKTTILEAILLALYGRRSFAFEESRLSFSKYLVQYINTSNGQNNTKVDLECTFSEENENQTYLIVREWNLFPKTPTLKTKVLKNGIFSQMLSENWDLFIEEMLPSAIAPFFFFDGEKISDLANSNDDTYLKNSIKSLLGINIIETAISDIQYLVKNRGKSTEQNHYSKELDEYENRLSEVDTKLKSAIEVLGHLEVTRIQLDNQLRQAENKFVAVGGSLALNRQELLSKKTQLNGYLEKINARTLGLAAGDLPLTMIKPLLEKVMVAAAVEKEQRGVQSVLERLPELISSYENSTKHSLNSDDFIEFVKSNISYKSPIYNLTDQSYLQLQLLCQTLLKKCSTDAAEVILQREKIYTKRAEIENYLSVNVAEGESDTIYEDIIKLTSQLATVEEQLRAAKATQADYSAQFDELMRQQSKVIEKAVGAMESADEVKRLLKYAGYSIDVLQEYKLRLQSHKIKQLATTISDCFGKLVFKRSLLKKIRIDETTLQFYYYNDTEKEIDHMSFSAGEKQLLVISILWALGICSKKQFPIIIDTPLARLDSVHRKALVTNYFPKASEQIILLSTDEEIYGNLYQLLSPFVGKEYTLHYDENLKQSRIETGYFGGRAQ